MSETWQGRARLGRIDPGGDRGRARRRRVAGADRGVRRAACGPSAGRHRYAVGDRVALLAAERCASPHVLVLPPPSFGFSPHHRAWAGTITLSLETFVGMVTDVAESLHRTGSSGC